MNRQPETNSNLLSPADRAGLAPSKAVYWVVLGPGRHLGYRKGATRGAWVAKLRGEGQRVETRLGIADDLETAMKADGERVLTYQQAQAKAWAWFSEMSVPGASPGGRARYTVAQACTDYLQYLQRNGKKSFEFLGGMIRRHVRTARLAKLRVDQLTTKDIEQWRDKMAHSRRRGSAVPPATTDQLRARKTSANLMLWVLKAALNLARRDRASTGVRSDGTVWKAVPAYRGVRRARLRFLSSDEQRELVQGCDKDIGDLVRGALYSGARFGELARVRMLDFNPQAKTLLIAESKSGKPRHIRLEPEASAFLWKLFRTGGSEAHIFVRADGEPWTAAAARAGLRRAWERVNERRAKQKAQPLKPCTFHELRHTAASRWVAAGLPLKFVATQLGHGLTTITEQYYVHLAPEDVSRAFAGLPAPGLDKKGRR